MNAQILNSIGLLLDIAGALFLFCFGPPQPSFETGDPLLLEDATPLYDGKTVSEHNKIIEDRKNRYIKLSRYAMLIIAIGFIFQLIATCVSGQSL